MTTSRSALITGASSRLGAIYADRLARRGPGRRAFLGTAAMTLAAAGVGRLGLPMQAGASRQLTALGDAATWINSPPLSTASLLGKPVLVQFGTYTCINWLRTLPYVRAWQQHYMPGLMVVGVHTPEFAFEKDADNVRRAVGDGTAQFGVLLRPATVAQIEANAHSGERMPPKTTFFHPKPKTGLVFRDLG